MADISIDEAKAKLWVDDVNAELDAVKEILNRVEESLSTVAGDEDSIMEGIYQVGKAMERVWNEMCNRFRTAQGMLSEGISKIVKATANVLDDAGNLRSSITR